MTDHAAHWHPAAAYLYVLHLDGPALAWEYLRRNPNYRLDWRHHHIDGRQPNDARASRWRLRLLEDPGCDARDAQPDWIPDPDKLVVVRRDDDPPEQAAPFRFWRLPGRKRLVHDGTRLVLTCQLVGHVLRLSLSATLEEGVAHAYAVRAGHRLGERWRAIETELAMLHAATAHRAALATGRPGRTSLLHMRTLQALDGALAGASQREVAEVLFGLPIVAERWHGDADLRAQVRRLIRRGRTLMAGGYDRLLHVRDPKQGR
jgi:hypothetical protein